MGLAVTLWDFRFCLEILKHHLVWSHGHKPMHPGQHSYTFLPRRLHVANILPIYWWLWLFPSPHSRGLLGLPNFKDKTSNARHYWDRSELQILHPPLKDSQGQKHVRTTPRALRSKGPLYLLVCSFPRSGTTPISLNWIGAKQALRKLRALANNAQKAGARWNRWI